MVYLFVILTLILCNAAVRLMTSFHIYIDVFDMVLVVGVCWFVFHVGFDIHSAISLVIGCIIAQLLHITFRTRIGFWIVTPIFSTIKRNQWFQIPQVSLDFINAFCFCSVKGHRIPTESYFKHYPTTVR